MTRREQIELKEAQAKEKEDKKGVPKAKAKAKSKGKEKAKAKAKGKKDQIEDAGTPHTPTTQLDHEESDHEEYVPTPKKTLFASDEEDIQEPKPKRRRGASKAPKGKSKAKAEPDMGPAEGEIAEKPRRGKKTEESKNKNTPKKPRGRPAKTRASPKVKCTPKRRGKIAEQKRRQDQGAILVDEPMKKTAVATIKSLTHHTFENLKEKLQSDWNKGFKESTLVIYWSRTAAGLKLKNEAGNPQIAYFSFKGRGTWNHRMTASFVAASLLAAWPIDFGEGKERRIETHQAPTKSSFFLFLLSAETPALSGTTKSNPDPTHAIPETS